MGDDRLMEQRVEQANGQFRPDDIPPRSSCFPDIPSARPSSSYWASRCASALLLGNRISSRGRRKRADRQQAGISTTATCSLGEAGKAEEAGPPTMPTRTVELEEDEGKVEKKEPQERHLFLCTFRVFPFDSSCGFRCVSKLASLLVRTKTFSGTHSRFQGCALSLSVMGSSRDSREKQ